ncbi:hypothetical protein [Thiobacter aerophilum]|uniref:DUF4870 domain-containing protein n=1 Tax=Thiobacter aerophilum TaxID=3121275 RepID=A0ABV0EHN6_9BURK
MKIKKAITAEQCRLAAQLFNLATILAVLVPILLMLWVGASMFVYAQNAHHPDERVARYTRRAGFRFYGVAGAMVIFGQPIVNWLGGLYGVLAVWAILALTLIPPAVLDILKARREDWRDIIVEVPVNE